MRKNSKNPLPKAKAKAWKVFSEYIRRRDNGVCFTCGKKAHWKEMDAGHYLSKNKCGPVLFIHEINVHSQCTYCNRYLHGNLESYSRKLEEKYGMGILQELHRVYLETHKLQYTIQDYENLYNHYKEKLCQMNQK